MARPERYNVDYFPHYIGDGKKIFYIEQKYGNDGYSTWFKILETLAKTDHHYIDLRKKTELMFLAAKCRISEETLLNILTDLSNFEKIDSDLWDYKIIYSTEFITSIEDAYGKRKNKTLPKTELMTTLMGFTVTETGFTEKKSTHNTQSKVKETKGNKSKGNERKENTPNGFSPPLLDEVIQYFSEKGFSAEIAKKAFEYYNVSDWKDSKGNKVKNWKQKMLAVWMKDENKPNQQNQNYGIKPTIAERARASREQAARELANPIVIDPTTDFFSLPKARTDESGKH